MTKEKLISDICWNPISDAVSKSIKKSLNEFFESNVCIPKGENRHIRADMIHKWAEGAKVGAYDSGHFYEAKNPNFDTTDNLVIKPSEPIYMYQWVCTTNGFEMRTGHISDEEFEKSSLQYDYWNKDESTKQERK